MRLAIGDSEDKVQHENDAVKAIHAALDGHRSMKMVTVVDEDIDIEDPVQSRVGHGYEIATRQRYGYSKQSKGSSLDPSRAKDGTTSKVGFDATIPLSYEHERASSQSSRDNMSTRQIFCSIDVT